jgi:hypothetical protein
MSPTRPPGISIQTAPRSDVSVGALLAGAAQAWRSIDDLTGTLRLPDGHHRRLELPGMAALMQDGFILVLLPVSVTASVA